MKLQETTDDLLNGDLVLPPNDRDAFDICRQLSWDCFVRNHLHRHSRTDLRPWLPNTSVRGAIERREPGRSWRLHMIARHRLSQIRYFGLSLPIEEGL